MYLVPFVVALLYINLGGDPPWLQGLRNEITLDIVKEETKVDGIMVSSTTKPPFKIWLFPTDDDTISKKINDSGKYEPEETAFIQYVASLHGSGGWAVDIGANIGFHSLYMAALATTG
jgi:predicted O-methyltransferase YrrM